MRFTRVEKRDENGLTKYDRYRLKDVEAYRKRKREWAKTESQRKKRREYMREWVKNNPEKVKANAKKSYENKKDSKEYKEKQRTYALKVNYGLSIDAFEEMKNVQNNKCLICNKDFNELKKQPHVDHDHNTGEVRGLLCGSCNTKLGWYEAFIESITEYLQ